MMEIIDKSTVSEENRIHVPEDKLKEEQKKEFEELVEKFKRECLKSYSINRSGEVIKKFNLPSFQPLTEAQYESKMIDAVGQAVAQAFIKSAIVMGNMVHKAVVKTFASSRVQQLWATQCTMQWSRLLLRAFYQGAWVLAIYTSTKQAKGSP